MTVRDGLQSKGLISALCRQKILPVLVSERSDAPDWLETSLLDAGLSCLEVTLRTPAALSMIRWLRQHCPGLTVGAGTVCSVSQMQQAIDAGAQFLVAPGATQPVLAYAAQIETPFIPGVMTPSEALQAVEYGFIYQKLFPAELAGGVPWLQAVRSPLQQIRFCPTGGVTSDNVSTYLSQPNVFAVGGTWLIKQQELIDQQPDAVRKRFNELPALVDVN